MPRGKSVRLVAILWLFSVVSKSDCQSTTADGCFQVWDSAKVNCMNAYEQSAGVSDQQCRDLCSQKAPQCQAVQYTSATQTCGLYNVFIPVGRVKRNGYSALRSKRGTYPAAGGNYRPGGSTYPASRGPVYPTGGGISAPYKPPTPSSGGSPNCYGPTVQTVDGYHYCKPTGQCSGSTTPIPTVPTTAAPAACPTGQVLRFYAAEGYRVQGNADFTFNADSETACMTACTNNQQPDGKAALCKSADYNQQSKQCLISSSQTFPPTGTATPQEDTNFKHFEKICVDSSLGNCQGPFFLGPQHILIGYAQTVTTASSRAECLQLCANSQSRFGFKCMSGMYYYQETSNNCILNSESRTTHPDLYSPETMDKVDYFEPGCGTSRALRQSLSSKRNRNVLRLKSSEFGGWTYCDRQDLDHIRFKECSTLNPNQCVTDENDCDPAKESEYDFQVVQPVKPPAAKNGSVSISNRTIFATTIGPQIFATSTKKQAPRRQLSGSKETLFHTFLARNAAPERTTWNGPCKPLLNLDGSRDCDHGLLILNGRREQCKPTKADGCE